MKNISVLGIIAFLTALLLSACEKENVDQIIVDYTPDTVNINPLIKNMNTFSADTLYFSCVGIPYPIEFQQLSGNILTVNDSSDLNAAVVNPDSIIDFVYPFQAVVNNNIREINNFEDLSVEIISCATTTVTCEDLDAHVLLFFNALNIFSTNKYTFTINYPVQLVVNGQTITLNQNSDYIPAIGGNPMRPGDATLIYPIVIRQFGQTLTLNSDQDVCVFHATLDENCTNKPAHIQFFFKEGGGTPITCAYFINYPVQVSYNGTQINIQSFNDYTTLLNNDPNVYSGLSLVYPVSATKFQNFQDMTFSSDGDICQFLDNCY
jgi:hypothetical protein